MELILPNSGDHHPPQYRGDGWLQLPSSNSVLRACLEGHLLQGSGSSARWLRDRDALQFHAEALAKVTNAEDLAKVLKQWNGAWRLLLVIEHADGSATTLAATDHFASWPLFIGWNNSASIGTNAVRIARETDNSMFNWDHSLSLAAMEFIPGKRTIFAFVEEVLPGAIRTLRTAPGRQAEVEDLRWFRVTTPYDDTDSEPALQRELAGLLHTIGEEWGTALLASLPAGQKVAIPLSGGLDSRILLRIFAPVLRDRLVAVCYGDPLSQDVAISRKVAKAMGIEHRHVSFATASFLTRERQEELAAAIGATTRLTLADGGLALARAYAVGSPEGTRDIAVFLPGHSGDGISGSKQKVLPDAEAVYQCIARPFEACFPPEVLRRVLHTDENADLPSRINRQSVLDNEGATPAECIQRWVMEELVHRRVLPELVLYRRYAEAMLPFFDRRLIEFFCRVPATLLLRQRLYVNTALGHLFTGEFAELAKIPRQGGGRIQPVRGGQSGVSIPSLLRRVRNRILRIAAPHRYDRIVSSCPMRALWDTDPNLKAGFFRLLEESITLPAFLFDTRVLIPYIREADGDYNLITYGVWNLATLDLADRAASNRLHKSDGEVKA